MNRFDIIRQLYPDFFYKKKGKHFKRCYFFLMVLLCLVELKAQDNYSVRTFTNQDSLAQNYVYTVIQDSKKFLWIGTGQGLSVYDGKSIVNYRVLNGLAENFVTASALHANGSVYFGHFEGGITLYDGISFSVIPVSVKGKVVDLSYDSDREFVWGLSQNGSLVKIKNRVSEVLQVGVLSGKLCNAIEIEGSEMYIATNEGLIVLSLSSNGDVTDSYSIEDLSYINITSLHKSHSKIWIGTEEQGIYNLIPGNKFSLTKQFESRFKDLHISGMLQDSDGNLWLATRLTGLFKIALDSTQQKIVDVTNFRNEGYLQSPAVLFEDAERNLWSGSLGEGLKQYVPNEFTFYYLTTKLGEVKEIYSGVQLSENEFWIATDKGIAQMLYNSALKEYSFHWHPRPSIRSIVAKRIFYDQQDSLMWIGTKGSGVYSFNKFTNQLDLVPGLDKSSLNYATRCVLGNTWLSLEAEGVVMLDRKKRIVKRYNTSNGLLHNDISSISIDSHLNVWFGSLATGLFKLNNKGTFEYLTKEDRFPSYRINDIKEGTGGGIWVATDGDGLVHVSTNQIKTYTEKEGILSSHIRQVVPSQRKKIWTVHRKGLTLLDPQDPIKIKVFGRNNGFNESSVENNLYFEDTRGSLWVAQGSTLIKYNNELEAVLQLKQKPLITGIRLFYKKEDISSFIVQDSETATGDYLKLPFNKNHLTFDFVAISLRNRNTVYYRHRLKGYESEWSPPSLDNKATYTNLEPGTYELMIGASDNLNIWTDNSVSQKIIISKPYWEQWWFYCLQLIVVGGLFLLTYNFSRTHISSQQKQWGLRVLVYILIFLVFEYLHVFVDQYTDHLKGGAPVVSIVINLLIAILLLPLEAISHKFFFRSKTDNLSEDMR